MFSFWFQVTCEELTQAVGVSELTWGFLLLKCIRKEQKENKGKINHLVVLFSSFQFLCGFPSIITFNFGLMLPAHKNKRRQQVQWEKKGRG